MIQHSDDMNDAVLRFLAQAETLRAEQRASGIPTVMCGYCRSDTRILPGVLPQRIACEACGGRMQIEDGGDGMLAVWQPTMIGPARSSGATEGIDPAAF